MTGHRHRGSRLSSHVRMLSALSLSILLAFCLLVSVAGANSVLPENRGYELVSPPETNASDPGSAIPALDGETVDFQSEPFGDASSGGQTLYQSQRTAGGWQTRPITPKNVVQSEPFAQTAELFVTPDLSKAIFTTAQPLVPGDQDEGALDLYEQSSDGTLSWITQGSQGGTLPASATFDGATPDGNDVVFDSFDSLVPQATGMEGSARESTEYLYEREVSTGQTHLIDVDNEGNLLNPEGAILGNGNFLTATEPPVSEFLPANLYGTTTHAISSDGSKIFFESPAPGAGEYRLGSGREYPTHLYMRKDNSTTVQLDETETARGEEARYVGASEDGSKVFFISNEALAGDEFKDTELYMYDTESEKLTAISAAPEGAPAVDGAVYGVTAISNDGSHVYYVAKGKLASNESSQHETAVEGEPNLYVYDTATGTNTFVTQLGDREVEPEPDDIGALVSYNDTERPAVPTPNGNVLVFASLLNLTGEDPNETVELYRYEASTEGLICISCSPGSTGSASFGSVGGGSYAPAGETAPMTTTGEQIFFDTENSLTPQDTNGSAPPVVVYYGELKLEVPDDVDVYEWNKGKISLISAGVAGDATLQGVTPNASDVLIDTNVQLTKQSTNEYFAVYDARVNGGFPETASTTEIPCDNTESCRGITANPVFSTPGTATFQAEAVTPSEVQSKPPAKKSVKPKKKSKPKKKKKKKKSKSKKSSAGKGKKASTGKAGDRRVG